MIYVFAFIVLLGVLVVIHELGHFLTAKWAGVRVEAFSVGFGKPIWKKQIGETEYRLALIPLGGYVKLYGETEGEEVDPMYEQFSFKAQKWYKKALIAFAGPAFNFILAFIVYVMIFLTGNPELSNKIGTVLPETPIYESNLQTADQITAVDGHKTKTWKELEKEIAKSKGENVNIEINNNKEITLPTTKLISKNRYGENVFKKTIYGLYPTKLTPLISVVKGSFFDKHGFKNADFIDNINGTKINDFVELDNYFLSHQNEVVSIHLLRKKEMFNIAFTVPKYSMTECKYTETITDKYCSFLQNFGIYSGEMLVNKVLVKSPSYKKLKKDDIIIAINGKIVRSYYTLRNYLQGADTAELLINRNAEFLTVNITPKKTKLNTGSLYTLGIMNNAAISKPSIVKIKLPFWHSITKSFSTTIEWIKVTFVGFGKLLTGKVSPKNLGGPMMIGKVAGDSLSKGISYFLKILAIISINLGIINLFPIPVLDGGLLVLAFYEGIMRRPMKEKHLLIIQQFGLAILLFLVVFSVYNDVSRFIH